MILNLKTSNILSVRLIYTNILKILTNKLNARNDHYYYYFLIFCTLFLCQNEI